MTQTHDEREWQAQERALRDERMHADSASDDPRVLRYRVLARALRAPLPDALPADFARRVAAQAGAPRVRIARFERVLAYAVLPAFGLAAVAMIAMYGGDWVPTLAATHGSGSLWLMSAAACVGLSAALQRWRSRGPADR